VGRQRSHRAILYSRAHSLPVLRKQGPRESQAVHGRLLQRRHTSLGRRYAGERKNEDFFANAKAQAWWALRDRFLEAFKASKGEAYDRDAIISLSPAIEELRELKSELSQVTYTYNAAGKVVVNKAPDGHASPNRADSVMICYAPITTGIQIIGMFG
jgi:hypothetical protein